MTAIDAVSLMAVVIVIGRRPSLWSRCGRALDWLCDTDLRFGLALTVYCGLVGVIIWSFLTAIAQH